LCRAPELADVPPFFLALENRLGMRYDRIIRASKRELMRYEEVRM